MDSFIKILILLLLCLDLQAQEPTQLNALYTIGSVSNISGGEWETNGYMNDLNGVYYSGLVVVGDVVWDSKCDKYTITQIVSTVPNLVVRVSGNTAPSTSIAIVYRPTVNYSYPLVTTGLPEKLLTCLLNERILKLDLISSGGGIVIHGEYYSDEDAANNGCPINAYYEAAYPNKLGCKAGTILKRKN